MLEDRGIDATVLDNNVERLSPESIGRRASGFDLIFVTSSPYDRWQCPALDITFFYETIRYIPRDRLVVMGAHVSERLEVSLRATGAAAAIVHEPEAVILDLCEHGISRDRPGVAVLEGDRLYQGPAPKPLDLESAPYPAFGKLPLERYYYELMGRDFAILEGSRGCPYRCTFCYLGMYGERFRQKSVPRFFEEIRWAVTRHGCKNLYFMDLEFALNRRFVRGLCEAILESGLSFNWCCQTRVSDVDDELVALMKRAGCNLIHFGVESGSERLLRETGKKISLAQAEEAIAITNRHGVRSAVFMNLGFPGETSERCGRDARVRGETCPVVRLVPPRHPVPGNPARGPGSAASARARALSAVGRDDRGRVRPAQARAAAVLRALLSAAAAAETSVERRRPIDALAAGARACRSRIHMKPMPAAERHAHSQDVPLPAVCPGITVAIPVYNEEQILVANTRALLTYLEGLGVEHQVLIGSNGSTDSTARLAYELQRKHPKVECFHLPDRGVGLAFREFVRRAKYPFLVSLDMDLSADLSFVRAAAALAGAHDIVVGSKKLATQRRSLVRKMGSDTFLWFARRLTRLPFDDYSIGAKGYSVAFLREHVASIDAGSSYVLDLCLLAARTGRRVACVPVACEDLRTSKFSLPREGVYKFARLFKLSARDLAARGIVSARQQTARPDGSGIGVPAARLRSMVTGTKVRS